MSAVEKLLNIARGEIGYLEKASNSKLDSKTENAGNNDYTKYARDLDALGVYDGKKNGYAWCDVFVDWCFIRAFGLETALKMTAQPMGGYGAGCTNSSQYYQRAGRFFVSDPRPGDQIFFKAGNGKMSHTGIVEKVESGRVYTIEGNTSGASGVIANGGGVKAKSYSLNYDKIGGYGRPDYSLVAEDEEMDIEKFKELWREMRKELQDNDASDYSKEAREWAVKNGLVKGGNEEAFNGMWEDILSREQMVTLLFRFAQLMGMA